MLKSGNTGLKPFRVQTVLYVPPALTLKIIAFSSQNVMWASYNSDIKWWFVFWISIKCLDFIWERWLHFLCRNWVFKCYIDKCEASKGYTLSMEKFMGGQKIFDNHLSNFIYVDGLGFTSWVNIVLSHTCINICEQPHNKNI